MTRPGGRLFWAVWGGISELAYLALAAISTRFGDPLAWREWPIRGYLVVLALASALYLAAMAAFARHGPPGRGVVLLLALLFRLTLWPTSPILEDDVYRYLWDGKVVAAGLDPFRFSPREVERSVEAAEARSVRDRSEANRAILAAVNHPDHRTIYPGPVQLVFGCVGLAVPAHWPVGAQVAAMKAVILLFDVGALLVLMALLETAGIGAGWAAAYGWCPLVIKEFANSGHLDALPTLFLALGLLAAVRGRPAAAGLGIGVGAAAKYFAILVLPLAARHLALRPTAEAGGPRKAGPWPALACSAAAGLVLAGSILLWPSSAPLRWRDLLAFVERWEMNDFLFAWGVLALKSLGLGDGAAARAGLAGVLLLSAAVLAREFLRLSRDCPSGPSAARRILAGAFTVLAAPFLFGPLAFPWYFAPLALLLPFARRRSWFLLPAVLPLYYFRFWFLYHRPGEFLGFARGVDFFDWVLVPVEFGIFCLAWGAESWVSRRHHAAGRQSPAGRQPPAASL